MGFFNNFDRKKWLYNGLIITFIILYAATAFVSFYHAITFFHIANAIWLSVLLSFVAEIGQASVLFSLLLTDNKNKFLPWAVMFLLTSLQIIGNVVSSFDWIIAHNDAGLDGFKRSILFFVQAENTEMFRVIVAWISGALLPVIALSMTALVAQNMNLRDEEENKNKSDLSPKETLPTNDTPIDAKDIISEVSRIRPTDDELTELESILNKKKPIEKPPIEETNEPIENKEDEPIDDNDNDDDYELHDISEPDDEFDSIDLNNETPDDISEKDVKEIKEAAEKISINHTNGLVESAQIEPIKNNNDLSIFDNKIASEEDLLNQQKIIPSPSSYLRRRDNLTDEQKERIKQIANQLPRKEKITPEQLERIRQIAKGDIKKK